MKSIEWAHIQMRHYISILLTLQTQMPARLSEKYSAGLEYITLFRLYYFQVRTFVEPLRVHLCVAYRHMQNYSDRNRKIGRQLRDKIFQSLRSACRDPYHNHINKFVSLPFYNLRLDCFMLRNLQARKLNAG